MDIKRPKESFFRFPDLKVTEKVYIVFKTREERKMGIGATGERGDSAYQYNMTFGQAIEALKMGLKVYRSGWNGKGMYLWLKPECVIKKEWCRDPFLIEAIDKNGGEEILALGTICMFTHDSTGRKAVLTGWLASQSDMLCNDWNIYQEESKNGDEGN